MIAGFIKYLSEATGEKNGKLALFPGFVNPGDMREMNDQWHKADGHWVHHATRYQRRLLDAPMTGTYTMYPGGRHHHSWYPRSGQLWADPRI